MIMGEIRTLASHVNAMHAGNALLATQVFSLTMPAGYAPHFILHYKRGDFRSKYYDVDEKPNLPFFIVFLPFTIKILSGWSRLIPIILQVVYNELKFDDNDMFNLA